MNFEQLEKKLNSTYGPDFNLELVRRAFTFASEAHDEQQRKSGEPFMSHPIAVAMRLVDWKLDAEAIAAALLHDVAEDTPYTKRDIEKKFGNQIAFLVGALTKLRAIRYTDAAERNAENLRRMVLAFAEDIRVLLIKLADRLHNMETLSHLKPHAQSRIAKETLEIYAPLANRLGMGALRGELEDLAFPIAYPKEYEWLHNTVREPLAERRKYVEHLIPEIRSTLEREKVVPRDVHARAKHWFSLWLKLQREETLEKIYDLVAVRAIVDTVEQCYQALGAIHAHWHPLPERIKDYIALPKSNGYRALHTTVFGPDGKVIEVQIKTPEMHAEAEGGIAAHWRYDVAKSGPAFTKPLQHSRDMAWIKQLSEWHTHFGEKPGEFLESLKFDFFKDRIFVFTPKGEVIDLPDGATPIDFAYHIHSSIGDRATGAKVNGKIAALSFSLKNGDIVEILVQKKQKNPSRDWLEFVKTSIARSHIRSALAKRGH